MIYSDIVLRIDIIPSDTYRPIALKRVCHNYHTRVGCRVIPSDSKS